MNKKQRASLISLTLRNFNFIRVHKYMESVGWKWSFNGDMRIPSIGELYQTAESLLLDSAENQCQASIGGFQAYSDGTSVELSFVIAESESTIDDLKEGGRDGKD